AAPPHFQPRLPKVEESYSTTNAVKAPEPASEPNSSDKTAFETSLPRQMGNSNVKTEVDQEGEDAASTVATAGSISNSSAFAIDVKPVLVRHAGLKCENCNRVFTTIK
ncbi:hypothetical protein PFISCL1PPCAC_11080, partial [Pristionchus fissidentatus]